MWNTSRCLSYLKDLESGDVQHTDVVVPLGHGVQGLVDTLDQPVEEAIEEGLGQSGDGVHHLVLVSALHDELGADLDLGLQQALQQIVGVDAQQEGNPLSLCNATTNTLNSDFSGHFFRSCADAQQEGNPLSLCNATTCTFDFSNSLWCPTGKQPSQQVPELNKLIFVFTYSYKL